MDVYIEEGDEVEVDPTNVSAIYDIEPDKNNKRKEIDAIPQRARDSTMQSLTEDA